MAIAARFGNATLFITFTANPNWPEIRAALLSRHPEDRPDIVARVFKLKLDDLRDDAAEALVQRHAARPPGRQRPAPGGLLKTIGGAATTAGVALPLFL